MEDKNKRFTVVEGEKDGLRVIAIIDTKYRYSPEKGAYPWFLWLNIEVKDLRPDRLPTNKEDIVLDTIENRIESEISRFTGIYFVGRLSADGFRELYFYLEDAEKANEVLQQLTKISERPFEYRIEKDENWNKVDEFFGGRLSAN